MINQRPSTDWPNRKATLNFDFVNKFECSDSWRDLTNKGKLVMPKNLYYVDQFRKKKTTFGTNVNVGGFSSNPPLFLRGDKISIEAGYKYFNKSHQEVTDTAIMFQGYITKVSSKIPMEMELEDNMWLLKQTPMDNITYKATDSIEKILHAIVDKCNSIFNAGLTVNTTTQTLVGITHSTTDRTGAQVLLDLQKKYGFESYFRGNELRSGVLIYQPNDNLNPDGTPKTPNIFAFQQNIIDDEMEYVRKDDIILSAKASNCITEETGKFTKDGQAKTKKVRLEVLVTIKKSPAPNEIPYTTRIIKTGDTIANIDEGERHEFVFPGAKSIDQLASMAYQKLKVFYYTGLRGKFTTFGIPFTRQGDNVKIQDPVLPERNGVYRVKQVEYTGGVNGLRQEISLDFKLNI
ncbi:MAG TPA: hypothetical protein VGM30_14965 [Puia sp.]|jgi:hypothetical protein